MQTGFKFFPVFQSNHIKHKINSSLSTKSRFHCSLEFTQDCILFKYHFIYLFIGWAGFLLPGGLFSSCGKPGTRVSHGGGFSCCEAQALGPVGFSSYGPWALEHRFNSCGTQVYLPWSMWDLPGPGTKPVFPALAGKILYHWGTREAQDCILLTDMNSVFIIAAISRERTKNYWKTHSSLYSLHL